MWVGKRVFDTTAAAIGLLLIWPLLLFIALAIKLDDGGSVFLRQFRIGRRGLPFRIWKFRTMVPNAAAGGSLTLSDDPRVTRTGRILRKFKLDELPQLINVVLGDMSLVGPRPELAVYVEQYTPAQRRVLDLMPGITGVASIRYRNESAILGLSDDPDRLYTERIMPAKIRLCLAYAARATLWSDLMVVASTIREVVRDPVPMPPARIRSTVATLLVLAVGALLLLPTSARAQRLPAPSNQVILNPGDALRVNVWRHPELSGDFTVGSDSALIHPLYQTVKVGGVSLAVARERLRGVLVNYEQNVQLTVEPLWPVTVAGEVRLPNLYHLPNGTTIPQAVALAGGPTERGKLNRVQLIRGQGVETLDLLRDYQRSQNISVMSGDQVLVARRSDFSFFRDLVVPLTTFTGAVAALITLSRQ